MLSFLAVEYAHSVRNISANVVRENVHVLSNIAHCTSLIMNCLCRIKRSLSVEGGTDTANARIIGPAENQGVTRINCEGLLVEHFRFCFLFRF